MTNAQRLSAEERRKAIVAAVKKNKAVVPAAPEAWAFYYAKRFMPASFDSIARAISRRTGRA